MANKKYLDYDGLLYFWNNLKAYFVKKENGKGLSENDLTDSLKSNYDAAYEYSQEEHAPVNAERNTLVGVQKNGTDISIDSISRKANITVPTSLSQLTNDAGFITSADVPEGSTASGLYPLMDGIVSKGVDNGFSRGDHVHPSDTSKVDKIDGKGLSTNDFTNAYKNKLEAIEDDAQENVIETIKINGTSVSPTEKTINITVPINVSDLTNDLDFQTSTQVAASIAAAAHLKREIVEELPDIEDADENTIYMIPATSASGTNLYIEYMVIDEAWEQIGSSDPDLSQYVKESELLKITNSEIDTIVNSNSST